MEHLSRHGGDGDVAIIVTAAGDGTRLGAGIPKALVPIGGVAMVVAAVERAAETAGLASIVVTVPADWHAEFTEALEGASVPAGVTVTVVPGAHTRQASVHAGLDALGTSATPPAVVLVHDAARPAMPVSVFDAVADAVRAGNPAVVPVIAVVDTIKLADAHGGLTTVPRADLRATQTPQGFDRAVLERAHRHAAHSAERGEATDDAGLVEAIGVAVVAVPGHEDGAKITTARDLAIAQALLAGSWHEPPSAGGTTQERS